MKFECGKSGESSEREVSVGRERWGRREIRGD